MKDNLLKNGSSSLLIGKTHYNGYFPYKINKLLKVTRITNSHNEFTYLDNIRSIENYKKYYTIPDEEIYIIQPTNNFYKGVTYKFFSSKINKIYKKDIMVNSLKDFDEIILIGSGKGVTSVKTIRQIKWKRKSLKFYNIFSKNFKIAVNNCPRYN